MERERERERERRIEREREKTTLKFPALKTAKLCC
jgi:hypothetical protein